MTRTTVELEPEIVSALDELSRELGRSRQELIHEAIVQFARQGGRPLPKGMGAYQSGRQEVGACAEELLRKAARDGTWR